MGDRLFVYGTLRPGRAPAEIADVVALFRPAGKGSVAGKLYDLGEYPGVVLDQAAASSVEGEIFVLPDGPEALARLDAYEDFRPDDPAGSLFLRQRTTITLVDGSREDCWIYVYNGRLPGA